MTKTLQENFKIKIPSKRDGEEVEFTLEQLFNDIEFGNALAEDLQLSYEKRLEAFNWLKTNVKQFISDLRKKDEKELIEIVDNIDLDQNNDYVITRIKDYYNK